MYSIGFNLSVQMGHLTNAQRATPIEYTDRLGYSLYTQSNGDDIMANANGQAVPAVAVQGPTKEELMARIAELEAKVAAGNQPSNVTFSISDKTGAIQANGLGRFPVTLYDEQWGRLLDAAEKQDLRGKLAAWRQAGAISKKGVAWVPKKPATAPATTPQA